MSLVDPRELVAPLPVLGALEAVEAPVATAMYRTMALVRRLDERMMILQRQGRVGFYGTASGQEAPPVAVAQALGADDWVFPALREGAAMLHRGFPLDRYVAQVFGNALDPTLGRQMPSHQADRSVRQVSWSSCIGTQLPHAVGMAAAARSRGAVAVGFLGDGATSTAAFASSLRMARRLRAPCVFVCQNNQWSISVPTERQTRARALADKALAAGLHAARVDGNDALAVYGVARAALEHARSGGGPVFVECLTYRMGAHSSSDDPTRYRSADEVERWRARDPVGRLRAHLLERVEAGELSRLEAEVEAEVQAAVARAEAAPPVRPTTLEQDVVAG